MSCGGPAASGTSPGGRCCPRVAARRHAQSNTRGPLAPLAAAAALPGLLRGVRGQRIRAGAARRRRGSAWLAGHGDDIADPALLQPGPELVVLAVGLIGGRPTPRARRRPARGRASPGPARAWWRTPRRRAPPPRGSGPGRPVHDFGRYSSRSISARPLRRGIGQEHAQLAVLHPPGRARVLPLHPGRPGALLDEPGLVDHQHAAASPRCPAT